MKSVSRVGLLLLLSMPTLARADMPDPKLLAGKDPGGIAVGIVADGFDYTRRELADVLARDGEGEAIAFDAVDGDQLPFAKEAAGTEIALAAGARSGIRLVIVRANLTSAEALVRGLKFIAATPARILLLPLSAEHRGHLGLISAAAQSLPAILIVASLPSVTADERAKADGIENLVLLEAKDRPLVSGEAVRHVFGCGGAPDDAMAKGAELKRLLLARLKELPAGCDPVGGGKSE